MTSTDVSVIIVVKNGEKYLATSIESVLRQSVKAAEILLVDGGSTDRTREIATKYPEVKILIQENSGLANARNLGIESAKSNFVAFLDHDDYWPQNKLELQLKELIKKPDRQYCYGQVQLFQEEGAEARVGYTKKHFTEQNIGRTPGTLLVRKSLFDEIGGFNPIYTIACDVDWFTRADDYQINRIFIPKVLLYKRVHSSNISADAHTNRSELFRVIKESLQRQKQIKKVD